ncbi:MAG: hypothetical protein ACREJB_17970 [Planctomycetaceae bacterium]
MSRRKKWAFRLATLLLVALVLITVEGVLRLAGVGRDLRLVAPVEGSPEILNHRLNDEIDHVYYGVADLQGPEPRRFQLPKPAGTYRIVVVGASTVIGYPYPPELAFPRHVEWLLEQQSPNRDVEVLNAGITAVNSFAVRDVVAEAVACDPVACDPDLIIVHSGHNEFYGPAGVASTAVPVPGSCVPALYAVRRLRLTQVGTDWFLARQDTGQNLVESLPRTVEIPLDSDLMRSAEQSYRENLQDMVRMSQRAGVPILLTTVASNLKDQSPIRRASIEDVDAAVVQQWRDHFEAGLSRMSEGDWSGALADFARAESVYDDDAILVYRKAECLERLGRSDEARRAYKTARDLDTCRFRAPGSFQRIVREVAEEAAGDGVYFLDLAAEIDAISAPSAPGYDLFLEHVHYRWEGHCHLGRLIARCVQTAILEGPWDEDRVPTPDQMQQNLGAIPEDHLVAYSFALQTIGTPPLNGAADVGEHQHHLSASISGRYHDLSLERQDFFADLTMSDMQTDLVGTLAERYAARGFDERYLQLAELGVVRQPWSADRRLMLARALLRNGEEDRADDVLEYALQLRPNWPAARAMRDQLSPTTARQEKEQ